MKSPLIDNFYRLFDVIKPSRICEVGTHDGKVQHRCVCIFCKWVYQ